MSDISESRQAMIELQTKVAFIEDTMRALDVRIAEHQQHIDRLEVWCQTIAKRMRDQSEGRGGDDGFEVPPHY